MSDLVAEPFSGLSPSLERLVAQWVFKPHRWATSGGADGPGALALTRLDQVLRQPGVHAWSSSRGPGGEAVAVLQPLDWDSRMFGMSAARLELVGAGAYDDRVAFFETVIRAALAGSASQGIRHVTARVDAADDAAIHALECCEFLNVDALMTFAARLDDIPRMTLPSGVSVRNASIADRDAVCEIAGRSLRHGRFHSDPSLTRETARRVYREWAASCCGGDTADVVLVAELDGGAAGFVACRIMPETAVHLGRATGTIVLVATEPSSQGRGIGSVLVSAAAEWCRTHRASDLEVGTQVRNISAVRLYERCGFRLVAGTMTFRAIVTS